MSRIIGFGLGFLPTVALAAEGHGEHGIPWGNLFFSTINFVVFLWVLRRFVWPGVVEWVKQRRSDVVKALDEASREREEAERLRKEWQDRLARLDEELAEMRERARLDAEREREEILAVAQATAERIRAEAKQAIEQELRGLYARLRQELAQEAFRIACQESVKQITPADHDRFVAEFVDRVGS